MEATINISESQWLKNNSTSSEKLYYGIDERDYPKYPENEASAVVSDPSSKFSGLSDINTINPPHIFNQAVEIPLNLNLKFSKEIEDLIIQDVVFRRFISEIEIGLNVFLDQLSVKLTNLIFLEEDWEIPNYNKIVLSLNFQDISFEQEMLLWKKINTIIYERIKHLISYSSEWQIQRIKALKKKVFIKLAM